MKTFVCQKCGHISFNEAPVDCPVCGVAIENFENDPDAIIKPADPENLTEAERKHIPKISITRDCENGHDECIKVDISVGEIEHVMEPEHFIEFIDLYLNKRYLTRVMLTSKHLYPHVNLHLNASGGRLRVIAKCNVHGSWTSRVELNND